MSLYAYGYVEPVEWLELTLGLSLDRATRDLEFTSDFVLVDPVNLVFDPVRGRSIETFNRFNPKVGLVIEPIAMGQRAIAGKGARTA